MRLEIDNGRAINQWPDDSGRGEWYPDDTKIALVDEQGRPVSSGSPRVTEDQPNDWPRRAGRVWDAVQRRWVEAEPGAILGALKRALKVEIDDFAGRVRRRYITDSSGQEGTYLLKREQALDYLEAGSPADTTDYPMVQARADAFDESPDTAAQVIVAKADFWTTIGAHIERAREKGKRRTDAAADEAAAAEERDTARAILRALEPD